DGHSTLCVDLDPSVEESARDIPGALSAVMDVTDEAQWQAVLAEVDDRLAGLVNCAGILGSETAVAALDVGEWRRVVDVNLTGTFVSCKAVLPYLRRHGRGSVVNISSIAGKEGNPGQAAYSAAKAGVIAFTKALAKEVATDGITVNAITPTVIEGPFSEQMTSDLRQALLAKIPMRRFGRAEEVAAMVAWICSEECSFTTGSVFDLTGGRATY
ncbi:MAG: SDR family oxidoreductase, partial [Actinobacteria bacterium]|nr:SDR family oxidoreductase [Actinomycetota bacterium]